MTKEPIVQEQTAADRSTDMLSALADKLKREVIMVDVTGSMGLPFHTGQTESKLEVARGILEKAARRRENVGPLFELHEFTSYACRVVEHGAPLAEMLQGIKRLTPSGCTNIKRAIASGIERLAAEPSPAGINHLVIVTDAEATYTVEDAGYQRVAAHAASVVVDIILIQPKRSESAEALGLLAVSTAGRFVQVTDAASLASAFEEITTRSLLLLESGQC